MLARFYAMLRFGLLAAMIILAAFLMFGAIQSESAIIGWLNLIPVALNLILIVAVYFFAKELIGRWWAFLPAFLAAFSPNFLAQGRYPAADLSATLGIFAAIAVFLSYLLSPSKKKLILAGLIFGGAQLMSFAAFLLAPYFLLLAGVFYLISLTRDWRIFRAVLVIFLIGWTLFYAVSSFTAFSPDPLAALHGWLSDAGVGVLDLPRVFLINEPIPSLIMIFFALGISLLGAGKFVISRIFRRARRLRDYLTTNFAEFAVLVFIAMYWLSGIAGKADIGIRQILPIVPFIYILTAEAIRGWFNIGHFDKIRNFAIKIVVLYQELVSVSIKSAILAGLLLWYLISAIVTYL